MSLMHDVNLTDEEVALAHRQGSAACDEFRETLATLTEEVSSVDALEILARAGFSLIMRGPDRIKQIGTKGLELFHIELVQALALARPRAAPNAEDDYPAVTQRVIDLIERNGQAYRGQAKCKTTNDSRANQQREMLALIQSWTLAVRGTRRGYQTQDYAEGLASAVNGSFRHHFGCDASAVVAMLSSIMERAEFRLQAHIGHLRTWAQKKSGTAMIEAYVKSLDPEAAARVTAETAPWRRDRRRLHTHFWNLSEQRLRDAFTFPLDELVAGAPVEQRSALKEVVTSALMLRFGDVTEGVLQHLHLSNPVRLKPFIEINAHNVFCSGPQIVGTHLAEILEALCATKPKLKRLAEKARADWLEARLSAVVRQFLPSAEVREAVKWSEDGGQNWWESDIVAVIDKTMLIFEAKSAKISAPASRGAIGSLKEVLQELVVAPSEQSLRLKKHVDSASGPIEFKTTQGSWVVNAGEVREVVRINILQDAIGPLSSHWPQLKKVGLIPIDKDIAPSMSVFDLESVFETLSLEIERCHYLSRRVELEQNANYRADELDLLAIYVETQFNLGEDEFDGARQEWYGRSLRLTPLYFDKQIRQLSQPQIKRTPFWEELLRSLERRRPSGWTRFGHRLLNVTGKGQRMIERFMQKGLREVKRRPDLFFTTGLTQGASARLQTISVMVGAPNSSEQFEANLRYAANSAFEQGGRDDMLAIYWFVPRTDEPYDFIGILRRGGRGVFP